MLYKAIRTENLTKHYGQNVYGVRDLDLEVESGEVFGLLGLKGAGKTTLVRLLLDYIRPTSGTAVVLGSDTAGKGAAIRRRVGHLPSQSMLLDHLSIEHALRLVSRLRGRSDWSYTCDLLDELQLDLKQRIGSLNVLQKRKLGLVQAFMSQPELYILDEPLKGLDARSTEVFYRLVREVRSGTGTVLFTSSSVSDVERVCDRVGWLKNGSISGIERTIHLRSRTVRDVELEFSQPVPSEVFASLSNLTELSVQGKHLRCRVQGDLRELLQRAQRYALLSVNSRMPGLEDLMAGMTNP